jgi:hypothetical protein
VAEAVLVYALVALAAAWTVWKLFLPRSLKARLKGGKTTKAKKADCGDGGCENCGGD